MLLGNSIRAALTGSLMGIFIVMATIGVEVIVKHTQKCKAKKKAKAEAAN